MITTTNPKVRTPSGHASDATRPRKTISETDETRVQSAGTRDEREKKKYEPNMSRDRIYRKEIGAGTGTVAKVVRTMKVCMSTHW